MSARRWLLLLLAPLVGALIVIAVALLAGAISRAEGAAKLRTTAIGVELREYRIACIGRYATGAALDLSAPAAPAGAGGGNCAANSGGQMSR